MLVFSGCSRETSMESAEYGIPILVATLFSLMMDAKATLLRLLGWTPTAPSHLVVTEPDEMMAAG